MEKLAPAPLKVPRPFLHDSPVKERAHRSPPDGNLPSVEPSPKSPGRIVQKSRLSDRGLASSLSTSSGHRDLEGRRPPKLIASRERLDKQSTNRSPPRRIDQPSPVSPGSQSDTKKPAESPVREKKVGQAYGHVSFPRERRGDRRDISPIPAGATRCAESRQGNSSKSMQEMLNASLDEFIAAQPEYLKSPLHRTDRSGPSPHPQSKGSTLKDIPETSAKPSRVGGRPSGHGSDKVAWRAAESLPEVYPGPKRRGREPERQSSQQKERRGKARALEDALQRGQGTLEETAHAEPEPMTNRGDSRSERSKSITTGRADRRSDRHGYMRRQKQRGMETPWEEGDLVHKGNSNVLERRPSSDSSAHRSDQKTSPHFPSLLALAAETPTLSRDRANESFPSLSEAWAAQGSTQGSAPEVEHLREDSHLPPISIGRPEMEPEASFCPLCGAALEWADHDGSERPGWFSHVLSEACKMQKIPGDAEDDRIIIHISGLIKLVETGDAELLRKAAENFALLARSSSIVKQLLVEESAILPIVFCCRTLDSQTQQFGLQALASLAESADIRARVVRCISGTIGKLAEHASKQELRLAIAQLVHNLVSDDDSTRAKVMRDGGTEVLLSTLLQQPPSEELQAVAAGALANLSSAPHACGVIASADGLAVLTILAASEQPAVVFAAAKVLCNICRCNNISAVLPRKETLPIAAKLIGHQQNDLSQLVLEALGYLAGHLNVGIDRDIVWIETEGLLHGLIDACRLADSTVEIALPLLSTLTTSERGATAVTHAGAIEVLLSAMRRDHRDIQVFSICCLANIASHKPLHPEVDVTVPALRANASQGQWTIVRKEAMYVLSLLEQPVDIDMDVMSVADDNLSVVQKELDDAMLRSPDMASAAVEINDAATKEGAAEVVETTVVETTVVETEHSEAVKEPTWETVNVSKHVEFKELVGAGAYAEVYHGLWKNQEVAVKRFRARNMNESELKQFMRELNMLATLKHDCILKFLAASATAPAFCIITEFIAPGNLQVVLKKKAEYPIDWVQSVQMATDAASGIAYLHSFQPPVIHRDLKSSNLLVTADFRLKVADFGTSRHVIATGAMSCCGTPVYMAPEVLRGEKYNETADIYSFGIVMWEILTRKIPFEGMIPVIAGMKIAYENARPELPEEHSENVASQQYATLLQVCWHAMSENRPNAAQVFSDLEGFLKQILESQPA